MSQKEEDVRQELEKVVVEQMKAANPDPPKEEPKPEPILEVKPVPEVKAAAPQPPVKKPAPVEEVK